MRFPGSAGARDDHGVLREKAAGRRVAARVFDDESTRRFRHAAGQLRLGGGGVDLRGGVIGVQYSAADREEKRQDNDGFHDKREPILAGTA